MENMRDQSFFPADCIVQRSKSPVCRGLRGIAWRLLGVLLLASGAGWPVEAAGSVVDFADLVVAEDPCNDSEAQAQDLSVYFDDDILAVGVEGALSDDQDVDFYRLAIEPNGDIELKFEICQWPDRLITSLATGLDNKIYFIADNGVWRRKSADTHGQEGHDRADQANRADQHSRADTKTRANDSSKSPTPAPIAPPGNTTEIERFVAELPEQEKMLILLQAELYGNRWQAMLDDLRNRLDGKPYIFKLANRIQDDIARIEKLNAFEKEHNVKLSDFVKPPKS